MRSPANGILRSARIGITPPEYFSAGSCTPNSAPPPRTCVGGAAPPGCRRRASLPLYSVRTPPVGGWGRLGASSWPQIRHMWSSGPPSHRGGAEIRWGLSVGWCPSKRVVVIHCARPYTAQKVSGGCVRAISGSASKFAEDTAYEEVEAVAMNS
jgi:hypothetical protein